MKKRASERLLYTECVIKSLVISALSILSILSPYANETRKFRNNAVTRMHLSIFFCAVRAASGHRETSGKTGCTALLFDDILRPFPAIGCPIQRSGAQGYVKNGVLSYAMGFQNRRYSPLHMDALSMEITRKAIVLIQYKRSRISKVVHASARIESAITYSFQA